MVLMPNPLVQRAVAALTGALETADAVGQVAHRLRTGFESTLWHLRNLGYLDDFARQRIEAIKEIKKIEEIEEEA